MKRLVFHADVNSAFLSWSAVERLKDDPNAVDLRTIPAVIGGDMAARTGIVFAKSIPAKRFGIVTGEPLAAAMRKCPGLLSVRPDFRIYRRYSQGFFDILARYAPVVEKFSIDEGFLDMTGTGQIYPDPVKTAEEIKDTVARELGFTVNIGISENKLLAKMASDFEKPDRVHTLFPSELPEKMWKLPVRDLLYVGRATADRLKSIGISTIGELAHTKPLLLRAHFGEKQAKQLWEYANGIDESPVLAEPEQAKGYGNSTTLPYNVTDAGEAKQVLLALCDSVGGRMRADGAKTDCVTVTIKDASFRVRSHQRKLALETDVTDELYRVSSELFDELWDQSPIRLLGVSAGRAEEAAFHQFSLFEEDAGEKRRDVDKMVDSIRGKYGSASIQRASLLHSDTKKRISKKWDRQ